MKVIYFTFLVLFLFIGKVSAKENCRTCSDSSPAAQAECWACLGRNKAAAQTSQSMPSQPAQSSSSSSKSSKTTTKKATESTSTQPDQQSSAASTCTGNTYPGLGGSCLQCPGNMSRTVGGVVYCSPDSGGVSQNESEKANCIMNAGDWDENKNPKCLTLEQKKANCQNEGKTWNEEQAFCSSTSASTTQNTECERAFNDQWAKCTQESDSAMTSCNDNNEEMQAAENTAKLIGVGSVTSMQVACSKIGELSKFANGALSGWKTLCSTNQGGCTESCTEAKRIINECMQDQVKIDYTNGYVPLLNQKINTCESYKEKIAQAAQHAAAALAQLKASEQCKNDTSSLVNSAVDQCKANPNSPLCKDLQKCSDANFAAQNPVCACASNPTSSSCLQASANYGSGTSSTGATLPGVNGGKDTSGLPGINSAANGDGQNLNGLGTNGAPATDGHGVGGRQGDASSAGNLKNNAAGGPNGSGNHYGAGSGKDPLKVNSGTLGGIPGGPGYFGRNPTSNGYTGNNAINGSKGTLGKFDPRKYITGLGGQREYINGANQNIFMIVKMRYEDKKTSLLPETFNLKK